MKHLFQAVVTAIVVSFTINTHAQNDIHQREVQALKKMILTNHFSPRPLDDAFSQDAADNFFRDLDPDFIYFTRDEYTKLAAFAGEIDDELNGKPSKLLSTATSMYKTALENATKRAEAIARQPVNFQATGNMMQDTTYALNTAELDLRWKQWMQRETMVRLAAKRAEVTGVSEPEFLKQYEPTIRLQVKGIRLRQVNRILQHPQSLEQYVAGVYMNAIASAFDAHTRYISLGDARSFMEQLSAEGYVFGITLKENDHGDVVVDNLQPGSPAWKSGNVFAGDMLIEVKPEGQPPVNTEGMDAEEAGELLANAGNGTTKFLFQTPGGLPKTVLLRKEKSTSEENVVRSFILNGAQKIGFISLPGFYSDWGSALGRSCAQDVAREIMKLRKENIDGLILDVRYNGGGSLLEAVEMAGIFIDAGPIGVLKDKAGLIRSAKDINRGTVYDGPLVLMVNGMSASASEFLAAAFQDYHRAIIVGGRTYGKATAQMVLPVNLGTVPRTVKNPSKANVSIALVTIEKIYRITGRTVQKKGVLPDILLPDFMDNLPLGESYERFALESDSLAKKTYYQALPLLPIRELRYKSEQRVATVEGFKTIADYSLVLQQRAAEDRMLPISWQDIKKEREKEMQFGVAANGKINAVRGAYTVSSFGFEQQRMNIDEFVEQLNREWIKKLERDISLDEAFHIICDYINITKRK